MLINVVYLIYNVLQKVLENFTFITIILLSQNSAPRPTFRPRFQAIIVPGYSAGGTGGQEAGRQGRAAIPRAVGSTPGGGASPKPRPPRLLTPRSPRRGGRHLTFCQIEVRLQSRFRGRSPTRAQAAPPDGPCGVLLPPHRRHAGPRQAPTVRQGPDDGTIRA